GRVIIAYSPLGQGLLGGAYSPTGKLPGDVRRMNRSFRPASWRRLGPLLDALRDVAAAHDATPAQVALAWLIGHGNVVAIPGARTLAQLEDNAAAGDLVLSLEEQVSLTSLADRLEGGARSRSSV